MKRIRKTVVAVAVLGACAVAPSFSQDAPQRDVDAMRELFNSFAPRGQAQLSRLVQDDVQAFCSRTDWAKDKKQVQALEKRELERVKYPAGSLMGDWRRGERVAQSGVGKQFSDNPNAPSGGNCYACHQLSPQEMSYGTIGPSLRNFGKTRGNGPDVQRYVYSKIYNAKAYSICSNMPRFGAHEILTEQQIKDVVALLLDPDSPVNK